MTINKRQRCRPSCPLLPAHTYMVLVIGLLLSGCARISELKRSSYPPTSPPDLTAVATTDGAIYSAGRELSLFSDLKARRVGDILTVRLAEQTQASKSASTDTSRSSSLDTGLPIIAGRPITKDGIEIFNNSFDTSQGFQGSGTSSQSNELVGDISVTVAQVLSNGNLVIQGEKWITLNRGEEFVHITGIVRQADIGPDNSIESFRVADARITYSGKGQVASSNRAGWFSRFFSSVLWPL